MLVCPVCKLIVEPQSQGSCPHDGAQGVEIELEPVLEELKEKYEVQEPFAKGDLGTLYLVDDRQSGNRGLLKIIRVSSVAERQRMQRELVKQASLTNSHLGVPTASGESQGSLWLFRPFTQGTALSVRLARRVQFSFREVLSIGIQLAKALEDLHRVGLVHRDIKPGHVLIREEPSELSVVLLDAGLSLPPDASRARSIHGYLSPERLAGKLLSFRSDLYSLGYLLYEMLVGRPLHSATDAAGLSKAHSEAPPPTFPDEVTSDIQTLVTSLLAKDPQHRPFSAERVRKVLEARLAANANDPNPNTDPAFKDSTLLGMPLVAPPSGMPPALRPSGPPSLSFPQRSSSSPSVPVPGRSTPPFPSRPPFSSQPPPLEPRDGTQESAFRPEATVELDTHDISMIESGAMALTEQTPILGAASPPAESPMPSSDTQIRASTPPSRTSSSSLGMQLRQSLAPAETFWNDLGKKNRPLFIFFGVAMLWAGLVLGSGITWCATR